MWGRLPPTPPPHPPPPTRRQAIDLVDEAAARVKMDMDQRPELLDRLIRRIAVVEDERRLLRRSAGGARRGWGGARRGYTV